MDKPLSINGGTYLGFDFGNKKIGIAVGDTQTKIASPLKTIPSIQQNPNWTAIEQLISEWRPTGFVVGLSKQQNGQDNIITPRMQKFCRQLHGRFQLPVHQIDETLTTFEAKSRLYDELQVSADKLWAVQDQLAAQIILQSWLDQTP